MTESRLTGFQREVASLIGPASRIHPAGGWQEVEDRLGVVLPAEYKWFMDDYGGGDLKRLIKMPHPKSEFSLMSFHEGVVDFLETLSDRNEGEPDRIPYPIAPAAGGLVPWGESFDGDQCLHVPPSGGQGWRIGVWYREGEWHECPLGFADWLLRELRGWSGECSILRYSPHPLLYESWR